MELKAAEAAAEAILFASGEPVSAERIAEALEIDKASAAKIVENFMARVNAGNGGLRIVRVDKSYQMVTRGEYAAAIRRALEIRRNAPLTQPSLEVLSLVAYNQPVTKGYVEQVRGVDCSGVINSLVEKGLLEERGRMDVPGKPILYGTTANFLRCFGLSSLSDLPPVPRDLTEETRPEREPSEPKEPADVENAAG